MLRTHPSPPGFASGYGTASRRAIVLAVLALAGVAMLMVWALAFAGF
ncbi:MAG TPA: hypothetical protein VEK76_06535 [Candidatus Binatia bacterium]|nr:hypothetical protein [Candidatus Binatia bacterium]